MWILLTRLITYQILLCYNPMYERKGSRMTQYERMVKGLIYDPSDKEIMDKQVPWQDKLWEFNRLKPSDYDKKMVYM